MRRSLVLALVFAGFGIQPIWSALPERVVKAAEERIAAGKYQTLMFGIVDGGKSEVVVFGKLDNGEAPGGDKIYEIGSVTKTFTATLLAKAVVKGQVRLDESLAQLVPDWKVPNHGGKQITLGDIGSQRSGLPRMPNNFAPKDPLNPYVDYDAARLKAFLANYSLPRDPGASYEYSNLGFGILGTALAEAAHKSYPALLQDEMLAPLGMSHSSAANIVTPELAPGRKGDGSPAKNWDLDAFAGAGAIRSSANDMLRYLKANMNPDSSPLGRAMALAQTPCARVDEASQIGLAWMTTGKQGIVWHNGMTGGYASFVGFTADRKHGVVILTNVAQSVDDLGFATLVPEAPLAAPRKALPTVEIDEATLKGYVGKYQLAPNVVFDVVVKDGKLFVQLASQPSFEVYASAKDKFFYKVVDAQIDFERDASGNVVALILHQNGQNPRAPRIAP